MRTQESLWIGVKWNAFTIGLYDLLQNGTTLPVINDIVWTKWNENNGNKNGPLETEPETPQNERQVEKHPVYGMLKHPLVNRKIVKCKYPPN